MDEHTTDARLRRCDFTRDGSCAAKIPEPAICIGYAYGRLKMQEREGREAASQSVEPEGS